MSTLNYHIHRCIQGWEQYWILQDIVFFQYCLLLHVWFPILLEKSIKVCVFLLLAIPISFCATRCLIPKQVLEKSRFKRHPRTAQAYSSPDRIARVVKQYVKQIFWGVTNNKTIIHFLDIYLIFFEFFIRAFWQKK